MDVLKSIFKIILGLLCGILIGFLIAAIVVVGFTDATFTEFIAKLQSAKFAESMMAAGIAILAFAVSAVVLVLLHEAGHLVCGLLSGYEFVSFRIFSLTFIRKDGKLRVRRYALAGTGGQCLLSPPDLPLEKIPIVWYNAGGILANIIAMFVVAPLLLINGKPILTEVVVIFMLTDLFFILLNGIPMKTGGIGNDAYNIIALRKSMTAKRGMITSLRSNALIQQGMLPGDLPQEWFEAGSEIDFSNDLEVTIPLMAASRLVDKRDYPEALKRFEELYSHKEDIIGLYVKEIECELVFLRLICGNMEGAGMLLTPKLRTYMETYRKTMSSKERILCAISLIMDKDREKAVGIYDGLRQRENDYILQGEVKSDLAIMKSMLCDNISCRSQIQTYS